MESDYTEKMDQINEYYCPVCAHDMTHINLKNNITLYVKNCECFHEVYPENIIVVDIKEFTEPKHVSRKIEEAIDSYKKGKTRNGRIQS